MALPHLARGGVLATGHGHCPSAGAAGQGSPAMVHLVCMHT